MEKGQEGHQEDPKVNQDQLVMSGLLRYVYPNVVEIHPKPVENTGHDDFIDGIEGEVVPLFPDPTPPEAA